MRRWMIWALLSGLWGLQGVWAMLRHAPRQALLDVTIGVFFFVVGRIVYARDPNR